MIIWMTLQFFLFITNTMCVYSHLRYPHSITERFYTSYRRSYNGWPASVAVDTTGWLQGAPFSRAPVTPVCLEGGSCRSSDGLWS